MKLCCTIVLILFGVPPVAFAQIRASDLERPRLIISDRATAAPLVTDPSPIAPAPAAAQGTRDSVKNGAIIGAVLGDAGMGGFVTWLCHMLKEPGDPSCWKGVAVWTGIGAGAGAAAGAGIDALFARDVFPTASAVRAPRD